LIGGDMIKRTIEISRDAVYVSVKHDQLVLRPPGADPSQATSIPCEDIGVLVVDHPGTTLTLGALRALMRSGAAVVICGSNHIPAGLLLPVSNHSKVVTRINEQIAAGKPLKKRLWKQLVVAKLRAQAGNLKEGTAARRKLITLGRDVKSGDPSNIEAQAAKVYWRTWLGSSGEVSTERFRRNPDGPPPNNLLNYGYAVFRAAIGRALVSGGLQPALGIHHSNRANPFCLADDLLEPLRPIVDARVRSLFLDGKSTLDQPTKAAILELLSAKVRVQDEDGPLMVALHRMVVSLVDCYRGTRTELLIPVAAHGNSQC
jgi:CRISPR-associated protein Cas1